MSLAIVSEIFRSKNEYINKILIDNGNFLVNSAVEPFHAI